MEDALRTEAEKFFSQSSMKGVPRAFSSETWCLRGFWTIAVLGLLGLTAYQSGMLVSSYLEYSAVTTTYEQSIHPTEFMVALPVMSICSMTPVRSSAVFENGTMTPDDYYKLVDEKISCHDGETCTDNGTFATIKASLKTPVGYFHNIGYTKAVTLGHKQEDFFPDCKMLIMAGTEIYQIPCGNHVTIRPYFVQEYFNCFDVISKNNILPDFGVVLGVEVTLYLDNHWNSPYQTLFYRDRMFSGAMVLMDQFGATSAGMMQLKGVSLTAGNDVKLLVNPVWRERQQNPYGECREYSETHQNSRYHCFGDCFSMVVNNECNCIEPMTPYDHETANVSLPFCLSANLTREQIIKNVNCRDNTRKQSLVYCMDNCPMACQEIQYQLEVQKVTWPMPSDYSSFYETVIQNKSYAPSFDVLKDVLQENCSDFIHCEQQLNQASQIIHANFVQVSYMLKDHRFLLFKDVKKVTPSELMSQLGGALNLWSGITVVVMLEVVELIYRLIYRFFNPDLDSGLRTARVRAEEERSARSDYYCSHCRGFYEL